MAGLISGIVGGLVVGFFSGSSLSVSGPAAGLTAIVFNAIESMESYEMFLLAVVVAGVFQVILGQLKAGIIGYYFPNAVIKGMLAAIGIILILKQIPHAIGYDMDHEGDMTFQTADDENTFSQIWTAIRHSELGAVIISVTCLLILILFDRPKMKAFALFKILPGALFAVLAGVGINVLFQHYAPSLALSGEHLVSMPEIANLDDFIGEMTLPDFTKYTDPAVYITGFTIALVASIETLLSLEAADKLDLLKRISPPSRELGAQGLGNIVAGMIGGIPITAVIVRSSANINSGGKTKLSAIMHGLWLLLSMLFLGQLINLIPLASLASILLLIGYKLANPSLFKRKYKKGHMRFVPFMVTIIAILFTDLLIGIGIGMVVGVFYILKSNVTNCLEMEAKENHYELKFIKDVTFIHKAQVLRALESIPEGAHVHIDGGKADFVDLDIIEALENFADVSKDRGIFVSVEGVNNMYMPKPSASQVPQFKAAKQDVDDEEITKLK
jgi:MFS superfamily sulfate permease-like transporter